MIRPRLFALAALVAAGASCARPNLDTDPRETGAADSDSGGDDPDTCASERWHADADGDGFGDPVVFEDACAAVPGHVIDGNDCDDADAGTHPGGVDVCGDLADEDCLSGPARCPLQGEVTVGPTLLSPGFSALSGIELVWFGESVGRVGDVNHDGRSDVAVYGFAMDGSFRALAILGAAGSGPAVGEFARVELQQQGVALPRGSGDLDGSPGDDLLVPNNAGAALLADLYSGPIVGDVARSQAVSRVRSSVPGSGGAVVLIGDFTGDGRSDLLVAPPAGTWLLPGPIPAGDIDVPSVGLRFSGGSQPVGPSGDTNADGADDVLMARSFPTRGVCAYPAVDASGTWGDSDDGCVIPTSSPDSWASDGDGNGDGYDDLLLTYGGGEAFVFHGPLRADRGPDTALTDLSIGFQPTAEWAGDSDGDGKDDVLLLALHDSDSSCGWVRTVVRVPGLEEGAHDVGADPAVAWIETGSTYDLFAGDYCYGDKTRFRSAGDVDGDGFEDIVIGAPLDTDGGRAYLIFGTPL